MTDIKTLISDNADGFMKHWMSDEVKSAVEALFLEANTKKEPDEPRLYQFFEKKHLDVETN